MAGFRGGPVLMAAFAGRLHKLLPGNPQKSHDSFLSVMHKANISRIGFLRHGQTAPSSGVDFDRLLTENGRQQANDAGLGFGKDLGPFAPKILVSSAPRTMETADIFKSAADQEHVKLKPMQSLYDGTMQPKGSALFQNLGYAPLKDYLTITSHGDRRDAQNILGAYAHTVVECMMEYAEDEIISSNLTAPCTLWMVGHAIYLPAAALGVASISNCDGGDIILSSNTEEAEGYLVDLLNNKVEYLSRTR